MVKCRIVLNGPVCYNAIIDGTDWGLNAMCIRELVKAQIDTLPDSVLDRTLEFISFQQYTLGLRDGEAAHPSTQQRPDRWDEPDRIGDESSDENAHLGDADFARRAEELENIRQRRLAAFGSLRGQIWMSDDFDAPLEEMREYME